MKTTFRSFCACAAIAAAALASTPGAAQDTDPPGAVTITGGATVVSDYRFRGLSQTDKRFAIQGTFTVAHESGLYGTVWGSSIDDYVAGGSDAELDFIAGYKHTTEGGTTFDAGLLYYYYPGGEQVTPGLDTDFFEPYVSVAHTFGPVTAKVTANYAWEQRALSVGAGKEDNLYLAGDLAAGIPDTGFTVSGHVGHNFGPSYLTGGLDDYTDWNVGLAYTWRNFTFGAMYVDTDKSNFFLSDNARRIGKAGFVGSVGVAF